MPAPTGYDFCGWATKNDLTCIDGLTVKKDAFKINDGQTVPLVWNHQHNSIEDVLGHAILENRDDGVFAYGFFNNTKNGKNAKEALKHGDISSLSIWANNLLKNGLDVIHGVIREVSLVLAGANPGAFIESVMCHGLPMMDDEEEGIFYTTEKIEIHHSQDDVKKKEEEGMPTPKDATNEMPEDIKEMETKTSKTIEDVYKELTEDQKKAVAALVSQAVADAKEELKKESEKEEEQVKKEKKEEEDMKHNIFETTGGNKTDYISHDAMTAVLKDAKRLGSLREAVKENIENGVLSHSIDTTGMEVGTGKQTYGFNDASALFPEAKTFVEQPEWISRNMSWVNKVLGSVHRSPFSRVKSVFADITEDEARAKGYIKGNLKKEEVFTTLKRVTEPQTIYKKQKMDRDDIIDITDFDVVAWIKAEMEVMFDEEKARAILIGDGRPTDSDDKIKEDRIRPIVSDVPLFNTQVGVSEGATENETAKALINEVIRSRKNYKGSGSPSFFTTEDTITSMLLLEDGIGHKMYKTEEELATALRVKEIIPVEPMEGQKITINGTKYELIGTIVNLSDYNVGRDKGGEENFFEDFDIDYNQQKYLLESKMSGALTKPFSALTFYKIPKTTSGSGASSQSSGSDKS